MVQEFFHSYMQSYTLNFIPVHYTPYTQTVSYVRPESGNTQSINTKGSHALTVAKLFTVYMENAKTCGGSLARAIGTHNMMELMPQCRYEISNAVVYEDHYWKWEPLATT